MKKQFLLALALVSSGSASALAAPLSLQQALKKSLESNREIKASSAAVEAAKSDYDGSLGKYLPSIGVSASYIHLNDDVSLDLSSLRTAMISSASLAAGEAAGAGAAASTAQKLNAALPSFKTSLVNQDFSLASLNLTQPLFAGGKITANRNAKEQLYKGSVLDKNETQNRVLVSIVEQYFTAQMAADVVKVRRESLNSLLEHQRIANALVRQGQLARAQKMQIDVAVVDAEGTVSKAVRDEELARKVLANTLDEQSYQFDLVTKMRILPMQSLESYAGEAQDGNYSLQQLTTKKNLLGAKTTAARAEFLPTLALIGNYRFYEQDLSAASPEWFVGLVFKMNLFNGGENKNELDAISQQKVALDYMEGHAKTMVNIGVEKLYSEVMSAKDQFEVAQKTKALAEESLRLNTAAFRNGFAKSSDVIDARVTLTGAQLKELKALFDYNYNLAQLLKFSGKGHEIPQIF